MLVQTLRTSKFKNSLVILFNDTATDGFLCSESFNSLSRIFTSVLPNSTLAFFHLTEDNEKLFEYNQDEDKFSMPTHGYLTEEVSAES